MTNQDRKTLAEALFAVAVENQSQKESRLATLEAENAKLRDLLRRVTATDAKLPGILWRDIEEAIEPGNPGELGGK